MSSPAERRDYRAASNRIVPGRFDVVSVPEYPEYADDPRGDELILVDGWQIGGSYACTTADRDTWASYGPVGFSLGHPTRQAAVDVQVREYAIDPSVHGRIVGDQLAEEQAERARHDAAEEAVWRQREAERRRARLGDDEPGPTILTVPAYHALYAHQAEVDEVSRWLAANGIEDASGVHEIRVEQRASRQVVVYEVPPFAWATTRTPLTETETHVVKLTAAPPQIDTPARPDLHALLEEHWPTRFPLIDYGRSLACSCCTRSWRDLAPRETLTDAVALWPCDPVAKAIANPPHPVGSIACEECDPRLAHLDELI